jgi:hypothetical protein
MILMEKNYKLKLVWFFFVLNQNVKNLEREKVTNME